MMPSTAQVFATSLLLANKSGASEISIDILLSALDYPFTNEASQSPAHRFVPVPRLELPLSEDAVTAIYSLIRPRDNLFSVPLDALRAALQKYTRESFVITSDNGGSTRRVA